MNENIYRYKGPPLKKPLDKYECQTALCHKALWIKRIDINDKNPDLSIEKMSHEGHKNNHANNSPHEVWNKQLAIMEICFLSDHMSPHQAYRKYLLRNPDQSSLFHDYYEIKSRLYRRHRKFDEKQPDTKQALSVLLATTNYGKSYWENIKGEKIDKSSENTIFIEEKCNDDNIIDKSNPSFILRTQKMKNELLINEIKQKNDAIDNKLKCYKSLSEYNYQFYQGNGGDDDFQVFFSPRLIHMLYHCYPALCDCTFAVTPKFGLKGEQKDKIFYKQLFSMCFIFEATDTEHVNEAMPALYILLANKSKALYKRAFEYTVNKLIEYGYNPKYKKDDKQRIVQFDYEKAERDTFTHSFHVDNAKGCFMHFSGNIRKNMIDKGLKNCIFDTQNKRLTEFGKIYRQIKCLSLLKVKDMRTGWKIIKRLLFEHLPTTGHTKGKRSDLQKFIEYFEKYYVGDNSVFRLEDWNFYNDKQRTQNLIERLHKTWLSMVEHHPWPLTFIRFLQEVDAWGLIRFKQLTKYRKTRWKHPQEREKEYQLDRLWKVYDEETIDIELFLEWSSMAIGKHWIALENQYNEYDVSYYMHGL